MLSNRSYINASSIQRGFGLIPQYTRLADLGKNIFTLSTRCKWTANDSERQFSIP